jgi:hypothetical protein
MARLWFSEEAAMADQLQVEPTQPGALARFLSPHGGTGAPSVAAFLAGVAGTAAFVGSLLLQWQRVRIDDYEAIFNGGGRPARLDMKLGLDVGGMANFSLVYLLGTLGLIVLLGSVLNRPDHALRVRMGAAGLGVGLVGVLLAILSRLEETIFGLSSLGIFTGLDQVAVQEVLRGATISYEAGFFCAVAAVVLLPVGVFLAAGRPARAAAFAARAQLSAAEPTHPPVPPYGHPSRDPAPIGAVPTGAGPAGAVPVGALPGQPAGAGLPASPGQAGYVGDLTVTASDAIDPGTETDVWRR